MAAASPAEVRLAVGVAKAQFPTLSADLADVFVARGLSKEEVASELFDRCDVGTIAAKIVASAPRRSNRR